MIFNAKIKYLKSIFYIPLLLASINIFAGAKVNPVLSSYPLLCTFTLSTGSGAVSCAGLSDGTAFVTASGGSGSYKYSWSAGGQTGATASSLAAATYTVTVTDNGDGCTSTATVVLTQPTAITIPTSKTNVSCFGLADGTASANPSGGNGTYTYSWTSGPSAQTATGLAAGTYTVKVTDQKNCTQTTTVTITQPATALGAGATSTPVTCFGTNTGTASASASGGTAGYTYSWNSSPPQTSITATNLPAGSYTVTISDAKGCSKTASTSVTQPLALTISTSSTNVLCFGGNSGTATATANGGVGGFSYSWNTTPAQNTSTASNLTSGNYIVTAKDANGCTITTSVSITQPPTLTISSSQTNVLCFGGNTGTATVTTGGGVGGYTYTWNTTPAQNNPKASNLSNGAYTVTVKDANGCIITTSVNITQPVVLSTNLTGINLTCNNYGNGSISSVTTGGTAGYTYNWSNTQTTPAITNLSAGAYSVTITDANNCTTVSSATITEPPTVIKNKTGINVSCFGQNDGKAWVTPNGSKAPYVYAWNPSLSLNDTIFSLTAGTYSLTVTDAVGCKQSTSIVISEPAQLTGTVSGTNSSCNGKMDGTVSIAPAGGTPAYTYSWNTNPPQTTATATNLGPGTYTISLSDSRGCEFYTTSTISEAAPIFIPNPTITKETCQQSNGKIDIVVVGGSTPFTYSWNPSGQTSANATNLAAGTYSVTVTDSKGCSTTRSATVASQFASPIAFASTLANISCFGGVNGKITVQASAGTGPYSYAWSPLGGNASTALNLPSGSYSVTVTDANGCTATSTTTITAPPIITLSAISTNPDCGLTNGTATVSPTGGVLPYTFNWSNSATGATASNLTAGTFTVTLTDANGCTLTKSITLNPANPLALTPTSTNIKCNGDVNGVASVSVANGSGTYNYSWSPAGGTAATASNLGSGTYTVTVKDASNTACTGTATAIISEPAPIAAPITPVSISCSGGTGQISVNPSGGTGAYTYLWSNGGVSASQNGLAAGTYTVTVSDGNNCSKTASGTINPGSLITASVTGVNVKCFGQSSGQASVATGGGSGSYSYSWAPAGGTGITAVNLVAATYTVTVSDGAGGCSVTASVTLTQPPLFSVNATKNDASCGLNNGSANASATGGTGLYTYSWSSGGSGASEAGIGPGIYSVTVTDASSCVQTSSVTIINQNLVNATSVKTNVQCNGAGDGTASVSGSGGSGTYSYAWAPGGYTTGSVTGLGPGTYTVSVADVANLSCPITTTVVITEPPVLNPNVSGVNITCNGNSNGQATSNPLGGTSPYTYLWSTTSTASSITGLTANTYTVTVTDSNGCSTTSTIAIAQGSALAVSIAAQNNVTCFGLANGSASITASGGTGTLTYSWSPAGGAAATASGLSASTYTVNVSDANNCSSTIMVSITQPPAIALTPTITPASCGSSNGSVSIAVAGGTTPYTYNWNNAVNTSNNAGLAPGTYTITVSDANACSQTQSATIVTGNPIALLTNKSDLTCSGSGNGSAFVNASGGSGTFDYLWAPGGGTATTISGLSAGSYTVTVADAANGACSATAVVIVNQPNPLGLSVSPTNIVCFGQTNGTATATTTGGTPGYTYSWAPVSGTGATVNAISTGSYTVTVVDAAGCTVTNVYTVIEPPKLTLSLTPKNVKCIGTMDGTIKATVGGGVPAYSYNWAPMGGSSDSVTGLGPGIYTLTITDSYGCTITNTTILTEPPPFHISTSKKDLSCYNNNGEAYVSITGGSGSFSLVWNPTGSTNDTIINLGPGSYQVHVADDSTLCDTIGFVSLAYPVVSLKMDSLNVTCKNFNDAKVWTTASGATAPYTYSWSVGTSTIDTLSGLAPGTYAVTVKDAGGCSSTSSIKVTEPPALALTKTSSDAKCFGGSDGSATITASGGIKSYTYSWSNGQTTSGVSGLSGGTYKITLRDSNSCVLIDSVKILQPLKLNVVADSVRTSCVGSTDGKANAVASGGTGSYTFSWSAGAGAGSSASGLASGVYTVSVSDANGCIATDDVSVVEPSALVLSMSKADPSCGVNNGSASVNASGSNGNYTYQWAPVTSTNDTISSLPTGSYTVTVSDAKGCSKIDSIKLIILNPTFISVTSTNISCNGKANGTANVSATGGSGAFVFSWSPGGFTSAAISGLSPGTYSVTVKDQSNLACVLIDSVTITQPLILKDSIGFTSITCFGKANGSANVFASGGTLPYSYNWSTSSTGTGITNLVPGGYTVTVSDANSCITSSAITITQPALLTATADSVNVTCNGYKNGNVFVLANGGTFPYTYTWNPGAISNDTLSNVGPGTYSVTITDLNNCSATDIISITEPLGMTLTMSHTNTACGSNIGTASVSVAGGIPGYSYSWSTGATSATINSLFKGNFKVTITDSKGCTKSDSAKVTEPNGLSISFAATNVTCKGANNGKVTASASGGTGSYLYTWLPSGATSTTFSNLAPGTYVLKVSDATNTICSATDSITITEPALLSSTTTKQNVDCFGSSTGTASALVTGGTIPYSYKWSSGNSTGATVSGLPPGIYSLTVTDSKGCSSTNTVSITQPTPIVTTPSAKQATCGNQNGEAYISATGGIGSYTYSWTPVYSTNDTLFNLLPGTYSVFVSDSNKCVKKDSVKISISNSIVTTLSSVRVSCFGRNDGQATITANGGSGNFVYKWSPGGSTNQNLVNIGPGMYTVTVTDVNINGCVKVDSVLVTEPQVLDVTVAVSKVTCGGTNDYMVTALPTGGTPTYTYSWSFGGTGSVEKNLSPGTYIIDVSDSMGCDTAKIFNVNTASIPIIMPPIKNNPKCNLANGSITVSVFGGVPPYSYSWSPTGGTAATAINLAAGIYTVTVTDAFSCTDTRTITLINTALPPNVMASAKPAICFGSATGSASAVANAGSLPYLYSWSPTGGTKDTALGIPAGVYTILVTDGQACTATATTTITEPTPITLSIATTNASCFATNGGTATALVGGGTPGYVYSWSSGGTTLSETNLLAGKYIFSVTDANGCIKTDSIKIMQPAILLSTVKKIKNVSCNGGNNGSIQLTTNGGTKNYTYSWSPIGGTDSIATGLKAGNYTVNIRDSLGCTTSATIVITEPGPFSATMIKKNISCFGKNDGQAKINISGGTAPYLYSWSQTNTLADSVSNLKPGIFTVYVIDSAGCIYSHIDSITEPTKLALSITSTTAHCSKNDGTIGVTASGATAPYQYSWNVPGANTNTVDSLLAGGYTVTVSDLNGCTLSSNTTIGNIKGPNVLITNFSNTTCSSNCVGTATTQTTGGTGIYTYSWNTVPTQSTANAVNLCAGDYVIEVKDSVGCIDTANVHISAPTISLIANAQDTTICIGQSTQLAASASGGALPYTYNWDNGAFLGQPYIVNPIKTTSYTLIATDANNCPSQPVTIKVNVRAPIVISANALPSAVCPGAPVTLSVTANGGDNNYSYTWLPGGSSSSSLTITPPSTISYTVIGSDGCGTPADTAIVTINVYADPAIDFVSADTVGCINNCTHFSDKSSVVGGNTIIFWQWDFGDGKSSSTQNPVHCYGNLGTYDVTLTVRTDKGCSKVLSKPGYVNVHGLPEAAFDMSSDSVGVLEPFVQFIDKSVDAVDWKWDFGDGSAVDSINFIRNPRHTYKDTGRYCVWQVVTNVYGCVDSIKHCLKVYPQFTFYIPNAFSPNGDALNNLFNGKGTFIKEYKLLIFDRWGNLIFETNSLEGGWDGKANGGSNVAQQDVYVWKVVLFDIFHIEHHYMGHVTLVR